MRQGLASSTIFSPAARAAGRAASCRAGRSCRLRCGLPGRRDWSPGLRDPQAWRRRRHAPAGRRNSRGRGLRLELANGQSLPGRIAWTEQGSAGFLFDTPIDVIGTLARNLAALPAERRSVPRVELHQTICVRRGNQVEFTRSRNLSQEAAASRPTSPSSRAMWCRSISTACGRSTVQ